MSESYEAETPGPLSMGPTGAGGSQPAGALPVEIAQTWQALVTAVNDPALLLDDRLGVRECNVKSASLYGYAETELRSQSLFALSSRRTQASLDREMREALERDGHVFASEHLRRDGNPVLVEVSAKPYRLNQELFYVCLIREISTRRVLEEQLRRTQEQSEINARLQRRDAEHAVELEFANEPLHALAARLVTAREEERTQLARQIHDEFGQQLTALKIDLLMLRDRLGTESQQGDASFPTYAAAELGSAGASIDEALESLRDLVGELRPPGLDELGLAAVVEAEVRKFETRTGIRGQCHCEIPPPQFDAARSIALFRILQESLTNVARHANATEVRIDLRLGDGNLTLSVEDNGIGMAEAEFLRPRSFGLLGMRERALAAGGTLSLRSTPGKGTCISATLPLA